jgi:hypothetical protein
VRVGASSEGEKLEGNSYLGELSAGIIYLLAGARLVLLGIRTDETPERFLGASFMMFGASGILYCLPEFEIFSDFWTPLYFAGRVIYLPGSVLIAVFTARAFGLQSDVPLVTVWCHSACGLLCGDRAVRGLRA